MTTVSRAQTPPPPPSEAPPAQTVVVPVAEPVTAETVPATPPPAVVTPPQPTIPEDVPPPPKVIADPPDGPPVVIKPDPRKSPMTMNTWLRLGHKLQSFEEPKKLNKLTQNAELDILLNAEVIDKVGLTANLVGTYGATLIDGDLGGSISGDISIMDLIARFDVDDAFHLWVGRMLVPSDRTNFSGPWFIAPWYYPGEFLPFSAPLGPHQGPNGRNDGATIWGQAGGGLFKYFAGVFELYNAGSNPLFSGRVSISLINPEPGFYGNSQYYGSKDVFSIGLGLQAQKDGSGGTDDFVEFNADVLFEKTFGSSGTLDLEGAFYKYEGDAEVFDYSYFLLASYLLPGKAGPGKLQPLVRLQQAKPTLEDADSLTMVDVQLGYVVSDFATRFALGYQYSDSGLEDGTGNQIYLGIQLQK